MREEQQNKLDQLFQSKLDELELTPHDRVWGNIEASLQEDSKKPLIPFYFRYIALVSVLVVGSFLLGYYFSTTGALSNKKTNETTKKEIGGADTQPLVSVNSPVHNSGITSNTFNDEAKAEALTTASDKDYSSISAGNPTLANRLGSNESKQDQKQNISSIVSGSNEDIIPSFELKKKKRKSKFSNHSVSLSENTSKNTSENTSKNTSENTSGNTSGNAIAAVKSKNAAKAAANNPLAASDKITVLRNNETIVLEIVGDKKVSVENPAEPSVTEEKLAEVDFKALKKEKRNMKGFFIGTNMGLNLSTLYFSERSVDPIFNNLCSFRTIPGYVFGLSGGYEFNNRWGLQLGVNFSRYNYGFTQPENDYVNRGELSVFQVDIPVLLRYKWNFELGKKRNMFSVVAQAGLKYSYITKYYLAARLFSNDAKNVAFWHLDKINHDENHQLGYLMGVEANYYLNRNLYLFGALSGTVASDITQFPIFLNNQLEKPTQLSGNVMFGVRYLFNKKKKTTR